MFGSLTVLPQMKIEYCAWLEEGVVPTCMIIISIQTRGVTSYSQDHAVSLSLTLLQLQARLGSVNQWFSI